MILLVVAVYSKCKEEICITILRMILLVVAVYSKCKEEI